VLSDDPIFISRREFCARINSSEPTLEIGPFNTPAFTGPHVKYYDVMSAEDIRLSAAGLGLDTARTPQTIHYISKTVALGSIPERFRYVFSSHAIEHTFDVFGHLNEVGAILVPGGEYLLAIPDKRFCFDHFKTMSTIGDAIEAATKKPTDYGIGLCVDRIYYGSHNDSIRHWNGDHGVLNKVDLAKRIKVEVDQYKAGKRSPMNPHTWRFTPDSFGEIMQIGKTIGYLNLTLRELYHTRKHTNEFFAVFGND
jgi:hypothetical protein